MTQNSTQILFTISANANCSNLFYKHKAKDLMTIWDHTWIDIYYGS